MQETPGGQETEVVFAAENRALQSSSLRQLLGTLMDDIPVSAVWRVNDHTAGPRKNPRVVGAEITRMGNGIPEVIILLEAAGQPAAPRTVDPQTATVEFGPCRAALSDLASAAKLPIGRVVKFCKDLSGDRPLYVELSIKGGPNVVWPISAVGGDNSIEPGAIVLTVFMDQVHDRAPYPVANAIGVLHQEVDRWEKLCIARQNEAVYLRNLARNMARQLTEPGTTEETEQVLREFAAIGNIDQEWQSDLHEALNMLESLLDITEETKGGEEVREWTAIQEATAELRKKHPSPSR